MDNPATRAKVKKALAQLLSKINTNRKQKALDSIISNDINDISQKLKRKQND